MPILRRFRAVGPKLVGRTIGGDLTSATWLQPTANPPTMTVEASITGRRYLEHRASGTVARGNRRRDTTFTFRWDLHLTANPGTPWRIARINTPARRSRSLLYRWTIGLAGEIRDVLHPSRATPL